MSKELLNKLKKKYEKDIDGYSWALTEFILVTSDRQVEFMDKLDQSEDVICGYIETLTKEGIENLKEEVKDIQLDIKNDLYMNIKWESRCKHLEVRGID